MQSSRQNRSSRRGFCPCRPRGVGRENGRLTPRQAFAEARGIVSLIKDSAAVSPIVTHKLRNNISVLEGSGGQCRRSHRTGRQAHGRRRNHRVEAQNLEALGTSGANPCGI